MLISHMSEAYKSEVVDIAISAVKNKLMTVRVTSKDFGIKNCSFSGVFLIKL